MIDVNLRKLPLLPRTLLWQTFALIALVVTLTLAVSSQIFRHFEELPRARSLAQMVVSVVNLTRTALINAEAERRQSLLIDLAALEGIRIYAAEPTDRLTPLADDRPIRLVTQAIREQLGESTRFAGSWEGMEGFWVSFRLDPEESDEYWVMLPAGRLRRTGPLEWLGWASVALLVALVAAYLIVSRIGRPLGAIAHAARTVGRGDFPEPLAESGPHEIAEVAHAFNQMAGDLARLDADRALILAGVSHDLRTPLARLRLGIEMSGAPDEEVRAMIGDIEEMDRIVGQFLDFGRDPGSENLQPVDLAELTREVAERYRARGAKLQLELPETLEVHARALSVRRALTNLIDNALRYAGDEHPIDITLEPSNAMAMLEVADRGPGIPAGEIERMRHPFTRLDSARSNTKGSGLGLAIVDRIMKKCHGRLDILPREGGGLRTILVFGPPQPRNRDDRARIAGSSPGQQS